MHEFYTASPGSVTTAASVPVLWDRRTKRIVSNDSGDIATMFATEFGAFTRCWGCCALQPTAQAEDEARRISLRVNQMLCVTGCACTVAMRLRLQWQLVRSFKTTHMHGVGKEVTMGLCWHGEQRTHSRLAFSPSTASQSLLYRTYVLPAAERRRQITTLPPCGRRSTPSARA